MCTIANTSSVFNINKHIIVRHCHTRISDIRIKTGADLRMTVELLVLVERVLSSGKKRNLHTVYDKKLQKSTLPKVTDLFTIK